jgi:hypothetical protein
MSKRTNLLRLAALGVLLATVGAHATPIAAPGYSVTTFAADPAGTNGADSVVVGSSVYVGYSNGTPKDGSAGVSTIVQYSNTGYLAAQDANGNGFVGALNGNSSFMQIVTGLENPGGEAFILLPEPSSMVLLGSGLLVLIGWRRIPFTCGGLDATRNMRTRSRRCCVPIPNAEPTYIA